MKNFAKVDNNKKTIKKMKHTIYIGLILICFSFLTAKAQVAIGKDSVEGNSTLLDFSEDGAVEGDGLNTKGIILPAVTTLPASPANGTFVFDTTDNKVKVFYLDADDGAEGSWHDLTGTEEAGSFNYSDILNHITNTDDTGEGTIIGAETSSAEGVLVLESSDKAMILPKVASPHVNVKSPYPGMMCYDTVTKSLAVFDGTNWYFWR